MPIAFNTWGYVKQNYVFTDIFHYRFFYIHHKKLFYEYDEGSVAKGMNYQALSLEFQILCVCVEIQPGHLQDPQTSECPDFSKNYL